MLDPLSLPISNRFGDTAMTPTAANQKADFIVSLLTIQKQRTQDGLLLLGGDVGLDGVAIGLPNFGASAPAGVLYDQFGMTAERVVDEATRLAQGAAR